jgi:hypothetical protein
MPWRAEVEVGGKVDATGGARRGSPKKQARRQVTWTGAGNGRNGRAPVDSWPAGPAQDPCTYAL